MNTDPLSAARGIAFGILIAVPIWIILIIIFF